jgi:hypothetical protein
VTYKIELIALLVRQRGDSRIKIEGLDFGGDPSFGDQSKRLRLSIQKPVDVEDEIEGKENWYGADRSALRLQELDDLIAALQRGREFLCSPSESSESRN